MSRGRIADTRIKMRPNRKLMQLLEEHKDSITEIPENIAAVLKKQGCTIPAKVEILKGESLTVKSPKIDIKLLNNITDNSTSMQNGTCTDKNMDDNTEGATGQDENANDRNDESGLYLHLSDLKWLNTLLIRLRNEHKCNVYLYELMENCELELPENEIIERNAELEARCQRLREEQQNLDYRKMTKNVDSVLKNYPDDTIAYQLKAMNSQLIAVLQFVISVAAGFVFGFYGIELIVGNLEFGFRLLLGIICALVIALAELYFLAKKLLEYDDIAVAAKTLQKPKKKPHTD